MRVPNRGPLIAAFVLILSVGVAQVRAQVGPNRVPSLKGHRFLVSEAVADAFVNTNLLNALGGGIASDMKFPLFEIGGDTLFAPRGDVLFAVLNFEYRQQIKNWLAVHGRFKTLGRLGTNAQSLLTVGVTAATTFEFGWLINLHKSDQSVLSVDLGFARSSTTLVDIFRFVGDIVDGEEAALVQSVPSVQGIASLRYAHGFSPLVGLQAYAEMQYGEDSQSRDEGNQFYWLLGGAVSVDPKPNYGVPIAALLSYSFRTLTLGFPDAGNDSMLFELKLEYSATTDFATGPTISIQRLPGTYQSRVTLISATISSRYYF
jgi:hypothetical protein